MPRIDDPTVAEHRAGRERALIAAAEDLARRSREFHDRLLVPIVEALTELGVPDPETTSELVNALVHAASRRVEQNGDLERAYAATEALLEPYLRG